jgi:hypothetical protein
MKVVFGI